jgi:hypothetical protein
MMRGRVFISKYMVGKSIREWFQMSRKYVPISSTGWKAMVDTFPLIGERAIWRVGDGRSIWVKEDTWEISAGDYQLFEELLGRLHNMGVFSLKDVVEQGMDIIGHSNWKKSVDLNIEGGLDEEWNVYTNILKLNFICPEEDVYDTLSSGKM